MRIVKILIGLLAVLVIAIAIGAIYVSTIDFNQYKDLIAEKVKEATGRDLVIGGDLDLHLSLDPSIQVSNVSFQNAAWGSRAQMMKVERFEAHIELLPLLSSQAKIDKLVLVGADILIESDKNGVFNFQFDDGIAETAPVTAEDSSGGMAIQPVVELVQIENSKLVYKDGKTGVAQSIVIDKLLTSADGFNAPMKMELAGNYNENAFEAEGTLGSVETALAGDPYPVLLTAKAGGAEVSIEGQIQRPKEGAGIDLKLSVSIPDTSTLSELAGSPVPKLGPITVTGRLSDPAPQTFEIKDLAVNIAESDASGLVRVRLGGPRPAITVDLSSEQFRLEDVTPPSDGEAKEEAPANTTGKVFPSDPLALDGLKAADAAINYRAKQLVAQGGYVLHEVVVKLALDNGRLTIKPIAADFGGTGINGDLLLDARQATPALQTSFDMKGVNLGKAVKEATGTEHISGLLDISVSVSGSGKSVAAIMASLNGRSLISMGEGRINNDYLPFLTSNVFSAAMPWVDKSDQLQVNCLISRFDIQNGVATSNALVFDTAGLGVIGSGNVNLGSEVLDMRVSSASKNTSVASLASLVDLDVNGTLAEPGWAVLPSPLNALLGKGQPDQDNDCYRKFKAGTKSLLGQIPGVDGAVKGAADALKGVTDGLTGGGSSGGGSNAPAVKDAVEGVGNKLKGLFGN
ncbi:AsmA family protein [Alphaproteobacteria bacterium HT1-32]|nr:AsmA family protein [Alphaproteobacteria bacterium HT1-32]|tara:strand:- start:33492 stop:35552 length:2061 start_codon:yes stop_codon:yes gene_type:complete